MKKLVLNSFLIIEYGDIVIGTDAIKAFFASWVSVFMMESMPANGKGSEARKQI